MPDSRQLLTEYVRTGSEPAFRDLVTNYLGLVYSAALRLVGGDTHLAEDVVQAVFIDLAKLASKLPADVMLGGWLHRHTCFVSATLLRGERRRRAREKQAAEMNALQSNSEVAQVAPELDEAINTLGAEDRTAVLLRFFEQLDFRAIGEALGTTEEAARKRVDRALSKLHSVLTTRGVTISAASLSAALAAGAVKAAPAGMASAVAALAISKTAAESATLLTILKAMAVSKASVGIGGAILLGLAVFSVRQHQIQGELLAANNSLRQQLEQATADAQSLSNSLTQSRGDRTAADARTRELMRLRGEVGVLKGQLNDAKAQIAKANAVAAAPASADPQEQMKIAGIAKMRDAKIWTAALYQFAGRHGNQFPTNFDQVHLELESALRNDLNPGDVLRSKDEFLQSTNQFDIVYQGSIQDIITNMASTIVLRERDAWQTASGDWNRTYGFADGHSEIHHVSDGNFAPWEAQHMQTAAPQ